MKQLRVIRICLAALFFLGAVAYLAIGLSVRHALKFVEIFQIIPSSISFSLGAIIVWFVITLFFGENLLFHGLSRGDLARHLQQRKETDQTP